MEGTVRIAMQLPPPDLRFISFYSEIDWFSSLGFSNIRPWTSSLLFIHTLQVNLNFHHIKPWIFQIWTLGVPNLAMGETIDGEKVVQFSVCNVVYNSNYIHGLIDLQFQINMPDVGYILLPLNILWSRYFGFKHIKEGTLQSVP